MTLGAALLVTKGIAAPEVEQAYTHARALCQQVGETPQLVKVLFGLWRLYLGRHNCTRRTNSAKPCSVWRNAPATLRLPSSPTMRSG